MKSLAQFIMPGLGGIFFIIGLFMLWNGFATGRQVDQVEAMPVISAVQQLADLPPDTQAVIEGKIAERNPLLDEGFVAYIREEYQGEECESDDDGNRDCRSIWDEDERVTPALWLDLKDGRAQLANSDYRVEKAPVIYQTTEQLFESETRRYLGFKINNPIFGQGVVTATAEGPAFNTSFIFGGDRVAYLEYAREEASSLFWIGVIFSAIGGFFLILGTVLVLTGSLN